MRNPADIIVELESDNSRLFKESVIIREMEANNTVFFEGIRLACDNLITFGVSGKTVPKTAVNNSLDCLDCDSFYVAIKDLIERKSTGNDAKNLLDFLVMNSTPHMWENWYLRILLKDLRCGVDVKTINKCAKKVNRPEFSVPVFSCQLANNSVDHQNKLIGEKIIECKLDGARVISIVYPDGRVDQFSRNGKELLNFDVIRDQLSKTGLDDPIVLDGEVMSESFQDLMKQIRRKENVQTNDSVLHVFDIIPLEYFSKGICNIPQSERSQLLQIWYAVNKEYLHNVQILDQEMVDLDTDIGLNRYKEINRLAIEGGYEGIMIKDPNAPYENKRSNSWLKLKPFITVDLEIVELQEGEDKYVGMLGAFICRGFEGDKEILVNVGSGFSDRQREEYWDLSVVGRIVEIKADAITQNQNGTYSLRFPVFMRFRGFETGEKI
jgi:DNA ligase-1